MEEETRREGFALAFFALRCIGGALSTASRPDSKRCHASGRGSIFSLGGLGMVSYVFKQDYDRVFKPYAELMGRVAFQWNNIHESLALLFWKVMRDRYTDMAVAIWNSYRSDSAARQILLSLAEIRFRKNKRKFSDIEWLIKKVNGLSDERDSVLHAPFTFTYVEEKGLQITPSTALGNRLAKRLQTGDLVERMKVAHDKLQELNTFCVRMTSALVNNDRVMHPWPDRPLQQFDEQKATKGRLSRGKVSRRRQRQPRSSGV
ncbi:MAG: hypothetical protein JNK21_03955 [Rhodospirillaceae bacterium]|nr:hypothetical protein [Rhodospirillaceae bacterium]